MGRKALFELVAGYATAVGTTLTAITLSDSSVTNIVRGDTEAQKIVMLSPWTFTQVNGVLRVRSTGWPEKEQGLRIATNTLIECSDPQLPNSVLTMHEVKPNEALTIELSGSGVAGDLDMVVVPLMYQNPKNYQANYIGLAELDARRIGKVQSVQNTIDVGATGAWGSAESLNAEFDVFNADYDYAIIGYQVHTNALAIAYSGTVTGNYRWGGPGIPGRRARTGEYFLEITRATGFDSIPTFRGDSVSKIFVNAVTNENASDPIVTTIIVPIRRA